MLSTKKIALILMIPCPIFAFGAGILMFQDNNIEIKVALVSKDCTSCTLM